MRSASVGSGAMAKTSCIACSWSMPVARPAASRSMRPPSGSGVESVMPATSERAAVDPHAVVVAVRQRHRPVGHDRVELLAGGEAAREVAHRPAAAEHPVAVGMLPAYSPIAVAVCVAPGDVVQVALRHAVAGHRRVAVGVEEAGQQHAALQVDLARRRAALGIDFAVAADGDDAAARDGHGRGQLAGGAAVWTTPFWRIRSAGTARRSYRRLTRSGGLSMPPATVDDLAAQVPGGAPRTRGTGSTPRSPRASPPCAAGRCWWRGR